MGDSPVAGAQVALCTQKNGALLGPGGFVPSGTAMLATTDHDGHFCLPEAKAPHTIFAAHPSGFGYGFLTEGLPVNVTLSAWGRISGRLNCHSPGGREVGLREGTVDQLKFDRTFRAVTDAHGDFSFEKVPPGEFALILSSGIGKNVAVKVLVEPGKTTRVSFRDVHYETPTNAKSLLTDIPERWIRYVVKEISQGDKIVGFWIPEIDLELSVSCPMWTCYELTFTTKPAPGGPEMIPTMIEGLVEIASSKPEQKSASPRKSPVEVAAGEPLCPAGFGMISVRGRERSAVLFGIRAQEMLDLKNFDRQSKEAEKER